MWLKYNLFKIWIFYLELIFLVYLDCFDVFILKINFKKLKIYIILIYFKTKNTLKYNIYHTLRT